MQVTLKSENEIDKQDVEMLKKILIQADVADNATIMLKEMEKDDPCNQNNMQNIKVGVSETTNTLTVVGQVKKIQHIVEPFRIILSRIGNQLTAIDAAIEYQKTGDGLKVALKVGATIIADRIFQVGSPPNFSKNSKRYTTNIRMLFGIWNL